MASYCSIRQSVLEDTRRELTEQIPTEWRNTYQFTDNETIRINGQQDNPNTKVKSHAKRRQQAYEIASWMKDKINDIYRGKVIPTIIENSVYEPITIDLTVSQDYVTYLYDTLDTSRQNEPSLEVTQQGSMVETPEAVSTEGDTVPGEGIPVEEEQEIESDGLPTINLCN